MGLVLVTPPAEEPVTVSEAKAHLRVDTNDDDASIGALITAARQHVEAWTGRQLVTATYRLEAREFPATLPRPPLASITSVAYVDSTGVERTLAGSAWAASASDVPGRIEPAFGAVWPVVRAGPAAVKITFTAGYGAAAAVPRAIRQAILLLVGHWYANREAVTPGGAAVVLPIGAEALLWPYRVVEVV